MSETDFSVVCSRIDEEQEFLNSISQSIWKNPELALEERYAHDTLTTALERCGFKVQKNYLLPTAFRAEHSSKTGEGPAIAVLLEYDALPIIGHACGHNLIAEAGLAAGLGIKAAMEADPSLDGTIILMGTPAEEFKGGKIQLLELGAFHGIDAAMMVHPSKLSILSPRLLGALNGIVDFKGKEAHAAAYPWLGLNALDAAVAAYHNIALLRQQINPSCRIHAIITKGGTAVNVITSEARMELEIRAPTRCDLKDLQSRVTSCVKSGAMATGCSANIHYDEESYYENLLTNRVMVKLYETYTEKLGMCKNDSVSAITASTDMGNISHAIPSIQPLYSINSEATNHTKEFREASVSPRAQEPTLMAAKALAMTALRLMRCPLTLGEAKQQFESDISED